MKNFLNRALGASALLMVALMGAPAVAQDAYPDRALHMIVPFAAGNVTDTIARLIGAELANELGQSVVVENRPGASAQIGMSAIAQAAPDGYTIGMSSIGPLALNPGLYDKLPYDPLKDFAPVSVVYEGPLLVLVPADSPYQSLGELVEASKKAPQGLQYASPGNGSSQHIIAEMFRLASGARLTHIPYGGSGQAAVALIGKQTPVLFDVTTATLGQLDSGKMRALAISSEQRLARLPNVPTMIEQGYPGVSGAGWLMMVAPAGTPDEALETLGLALEKVMARDNVRQKILNLGGTPVAMSPRESSAFMNAEHDRWGKVIREAGIKLQ